MDTDQLLRKAMTLLQRQKIGPAKAICRKVLNQAPDNFNAQHLYGVLALKEQRYELADQALTVATQMHASDKHLAQAWNNLTLTRIYDQRLSDAWDAATTAIELDAEQPSFWLNRAIISENSNHWAQAENDCHKALALDPKNAETVTRLTITLRQQKQLEAATTLVTQNQDLLLNTLDPDIIGEWALISCLTGYQQRVTEFCQLLMTHQHNNIAISLADYAAEENAFDVALSLYQLAASFEPDNETVQHMLQALQIAFREKTSPENSSPENTSPQAPHSYVQTLYDKHAEQFEQRLVNQLHYSAPDLIAQRLSNLTDNGFDTVLDLGCGTGLVGKALKQRFELKQLVGVDLSRKMLQQAQHKEIYDRLIQANLLDHLQAAKYADQSLIVAADVLIYLGDLNDLFAAVCNRLAQDGLFVFTVEASDQKYQLVPSGRYQHSESYLRQLLEDNNFSLTMLEHFPLREENQQVIDGLLVIAHKQEQKDEF